jgi:GMP synthase (glutamine-hydrolysing)
LLAPKAQSPFFKTMNEQIVILDFGSQYTQVIARRIRECNVYSTILRYDTPASEIAALEPKGLILSGGPSSVYADEAPLPDKEIFKLKVPVLGVCYGLQLMAHFLGGKVEPGQKREYGKGTLTIKDKSCALFANLPNELQIWNSHGDKLTKLPKGFSPVAVSDNSPFSAVEDRARRFYGIQFHPEVAHTPRGREIISNFVHGICGCGKEWNMRNYVDQAVDEIRAQVGNERVILGLSGGVDSSVAAALLHKQSNRRSTHLHLRQQRPAARQRRRHGAGSFRQTFQDPPAIRRRLETFPHRPQRRDRSRAQT